MGTWCQKLEMDIHAQILTSWLTQNIGMNQVTEEQSDQGD